MFKFIAIKYKLLFLFVFFIAIELRWMLELFGIHMLNPYIVLSIMSLIFLIFNFSCLFIIHKHISRHITYYFVLLLIIITFIISILNYVELLQYSDFDVVVDIGMWTINIALFVLAADIQIWQEIWKYKNAIIIIILIYIMLPIIVLFLLGNASINNYNLRNLFYFLEINKTTSHGISYQEYGDKLSFLSFFMIIISNNTKQKIILIFLTLLSLYVVGSKAGLAGFMFAIAIYFLIDMAVNKQYKKIATFVLLGSSLVLFITVLVIGNTKLQESNNWVVRSFAEAQNDRSVRERSEIFDKNMQNIHSRFLLGEYKFDVKEGNTGRYTHNLIILIEYYGIYVFICYLYIFIYFIYYIIYLKYKDGNYLINLSFLMLLFNFLLCVIARTPQNYLFYFMLGTATAALECKHNKIIFCELGRETF